MATAVLDTLTALDTLANTDTLAAASSIADSLKSASAIAADTLASKSALASTNETVSGIGLTASNIWMMLCTALVFIMNLGFATVESGLARSKNTTNILFKNTIQLSISS